MMMMGKPKRGCRIGVVAALALVLGGNAGYAEEIADAARDWPPTLPGANESGTVTISDPALLDVPAAVLERAGEAQAAPFVVASAVPTVRLAYHRDLGADAIHRRLWSAWGDICVADDDRVYCAIGDHHRDLQGDARCLLYRWDPQRHVLEQVVDMNQVTPAEPGRPSWSKVHARIDQGRDGGIYFSCTLNSGERAGRAGVGWTDAVPGGQLYRFDPATGAVRVVTNLPPARCTATALLDRRHDTWWCNLEGGDGNALWGYDLAAGRALIRTPDGSVGFNRNFALTSDGDILFNGPSGLCRLDRTTGAWTATGAAFDGSPGMRASTRQSRTGIVFGVTHQTHRLFAFHVDSSRVEDLGPVWLTGEYTTVIVLSPDERFLYYLPGAHGRAWRSGTPVIQYDIAARRRKVLAFLAPALEARCQYVPGGTYGAKLSADGGTLYVNLNGHAGDAIRPASMKPNGFGLTSFAAIEIPPSER